MAETKPAAAKAASSVQAKKGGNAISFIAPIVCIIAGYLIWRFILGNASGFKEPDVSGAWFWPKHHRPIGDMNKIYEGGIIVPFLIGLFLMVIVFSIERFLTISKAMGAGNATDFIRKIQYHLANKNIDAAIAECDKQKGSIAAVIFVGLTTQVTDVYGIKRDSQFVNTLEDNLIQRGAPNKLVSDRAKVIISNKIEEILK